MEKSTKPLISIVVPVFNAAQYIVECLNSVVAQTYTNLEVILVDDCSTDDSFAVARKFVESYDGPVKFSFFAHDRNRGASAAKNTGLLAVSGEYVSFLDSDDYLSPDTYKRLMYEMENNGQDVWLVACCCYSVYDGKLTEGFAAPERKYKVSPEDFATEFLLKKAPHMNGGKLIRRDVFRNCSFREGRVNEDWLFVLDIHSYVEEMKLYSIVIPDRLYFYRMHPGSVAHKSDCSLFFISFDDWREAITRMWSERPELVPAMEQKFSMEVYRKTMEARSKDSGTHFVFDKLYREYVNIPFRKIAPALDMKSKIAFLSLKYFPRLYDIIKH